MKSSLFPLLTALLILLASITACDQNKTEPAGLEPGEAASDNEPAYGDMLVEGSIGDASNFLPPLASDTASHDVVDLVYNALIKVDENMNIVGDLAESWDVSPDGLALTFHLKKGVRWHDGEPFTARDVMFTYKAMIDPDTGTPYGEDFKQVRKAEVLDDHTIRVRYARPYAPALVSWGMEIMPAHLLEGQKLSETPLARRPVGTGPYKLREWETGRKIVLEANHDYFGGRPYIERTVYRIIPDLAAMFLELKSGGIDLMTLTPNQFVKETNYPEFSEQFNKYRYLYSGYAYLGFNLLDPKFQDKRVRQAIAYALDKEGDRQGGAARPGRPGQRPL